VTVGIEHVHVYNMAGVCTTCGWDADEQATDHKFCDAIDKRLERLAEAAADLYCAMRREGWEKGPNEDVAAQTVMHLVANEGIDVHARLMVWRGEHDNEAELTEHRETCDGCTVCDIDVRVRRTR